MTITKSAIMNTRKALLTLAAAALTGLNAYATDIVVKPGAYTIEKALQQAREARRLDKATDICLRLEAGTYNLNQPIIIRPEDNGTRIVADGNAVISGGVKISGWKKEGKYYVASVPDFNGRPLEFRQMWVNGKKAVRARDVEDFEDMFRIRNIDKAKETLYVPAEAVKKIMNAQYAEMVLHEMWCVANLRIKDIKIQGDSAAVTFHQPESHVHFMHPWPSPMVTTDGHNSPFYLTNAKELLDTEGEWYLDARASKLYYIPRKGENMKSAEVIVPAVETLLKVEGTPDNPVKDVTFEGVTFSHATWMRPSVSGHAPLQAGMYMIEAYKLRPKMNRPNGDHKLDNQGWVGRPAAAVSLNCAENVSFSKCTFEHNASTGLDYHLYIKGGSVDRCTFSDIGGNGILAGSFGPEGHEAHLPYDPADGRIICTGLNITNNLITGMLDVQQPGQRQPYPPLCQAHVRHGRNIHPGVATALVHRGQRSPRHLHAELRTRPQPLVLPLYGRRLVVHNRKEQLDSGGEVPQKRQRSGQHLGKQRSERGRQHKGCCRNNTRKQVRRQTPSICPTSHSKKPCLRKAVFHLVAKNHACERRSFTS